MQIALTTDRRDAIKGNIEYTITDDGNYRAIFAATQVSENLCKRQLAYLHTNYQERDTRYKPVQLIHIHTGLVVAEIPASKVKDAIKTFESTYWSNTEPNVLYMVSNTMRFTIRSKIKYEVLFNGKD